MRPILVAALSLLLSLPAPVQASTPSVGVIVATADATLCGTVPELLLSTSIASRVGCDALIQFRLPSAATGMRIESASLRGVFLAGTATGASGRGVHEFSLASDAWSETPAWDTVPTSESAPFASFDAQAAPNSTLVRFDVTDLVRAEQLADGTISFRIAANGSDPSARAQWGSREGRGFELEVVLESTPPMRAGELVGAVSSGETMTSAIVAFDPEVRMQRRLQELEGFNRLAGVSMDAAGGSLLLDRYMPGLLRTTSSGASRVERILESELPSGGMALIADPEGGSLLLRVVDWSFAELIAIDDAGTPRVMSEGPLLFMPVAMVVESTGDVLVLVRSEDWSGSSIVRIARADGTQTVLSTGQLLSPYATSIAMGPDGAIFVGQYVTPGIVRVDPQTGTQSSEPGSEPGTGLLVEPDGNFIVGCCDDIDGAVIRRIDRTTGAVSTLFEDNWSDLTALTWGPDGKALLVSNGSAIGFVRSLDLATGTVRSLVGVLHSHGVEAALLHDRKLLLNGDLSTPWMRYDVQGGTQAPVLGAEDFPTSYDKVIAGVMSLQWVPPGRLYGVSRAEGRVVEIDLPTRTHSIVSALTDVQAIAWDPGDGIVAIRRRGTAAPRIVRIDPDTGASSLLSEGDQLRSPHALAVAPDGRILVADSEAHAVIAIHPVTGAQVVLAMNLAPRDPYTGIYWGGPYAIAVGAGGRVFAGRPGLFALSLEGGADVLLSYSAVDAILPGAFAPVLSRCEDGFDNDGDGHSDWPGDAGCRSARDDSEVLGACGVGGEVAFLLAVLCWRRVGRRGSRLRQRGFVA